MGQYFERISTGVNDPLLATAMAIESGSGDMQAIMVSMDILEGGYKLQKDLRALLSGRLPGFNLTNLIINATHDHCAPYPFTPPDRSAPSGMITGDAWRTNTLLPKLANVVVQAWSNRVAAAVSFQKGAADVGFCRVATYQDGHAEMYGSTSDPDFKEMESGNDHSVGILYCFDGNGNIKGIVVNVANPPQEVQDDTVITASVWGAVRTQLQSAYPGVMILPQCSAAGCQGPWDLLAGDDVEDDWDRLTEHATKIANLVETNFAAAYSSRQSSIDLGHQVTNCTLTQKAVYGGTYPWELHVIKIGNTVFANNPFELYLDYGFAIKALSMADHTMLVQLSGNADDVHLTQYENPELYLGYQVGYLPTTRAVSGGAYGAQDENGGVGPDGGAQLVDQTVSLINSMMDGSSTTIVDETNAGIIYGGSGWNSHREPGLYNLNAEYTSNANDYAQYTFTGTSIKWYDALTSDRGNADVYIDGSYQTTVDGYSPITLYQYEMFRETGLPNDSHTIKIVNKGTKNGNSGGYIVGVDYFVVGTGGGGGGTVAAPFFSPPAGTYNNAQPVTIYSATSGASIRYTINGSTPSSTNGTVYGSAVNISSNTTLKAIAYKSGMNDSSVSSGDYSFQAAAPTFSPPAGTYTNTQSVTISTATSGASIRYTINGSTPSSTNGTVYGSAVNISTNTTLKAIAYKSGMSDSSVSSGDYSVQAAAPTFSPPAGTYINSQSVTISTTTGGASIRYTTDGSAPSSTNGTVYSSAVSLTNNTTLKAIAYRDGMSDSSVTSGAYYIEAAAPAFSPPAGTYINSQSVTISTTTSGASIRYTTDGSAPSSTNGTIYSSAVNISTNTTLKAIAYKSGMSDSSVSSGDYYIQAAAPAFSPPAGTYINSQSVTISTTTGGASIRYTTDGSAPSSTNGTVYSSAASLTNNTTLKAIAYKDGMSDSSVSSGDYSVQAAAPTFSPPAGTYTNAQSVTISSTTGGASVRYTTDGSAPSSTNGTVYSSAVSITNNTTLKAIAYKDGMSDGSVASGDYYIQPTLTATLSGSTLVISWAPAGGALQVAWQLMSTDTIWSDVGTANPTTITINPGTNQFYRVRQP